MTEFTFLQTQTNMLEDAVNEQAWCPQVKQKEKPPVIHEHNVGHLVNYKMDKPRHGTAQESMSVG